MEKPERYNRTLSLFQEGDQLLCHRVTVPHCGLELTDVGEAGVSMFQSPRVDHLLGKPTSALSVSGTEVTSICSGADCALDLAVGLTPRS